MTETVEALVITASAATFLAVCITIVEWLRRER